MFGFKDLGTQKDLSVIELHINVKTSSLNLFITIFNSSNLSCKKYNYFKETYYSSKKDMYFKTLFGATIRTGKHLCSYSNYS